jgi:methyl-accepting chemotaxis protein
MLNLNYETILVAAITVIALAVLLQTILLLAIFFAVRKTARSLRETSEELRSAVVPVAHLVRDTISHLAPKVEAVANDLTKVAQTLCVQSTELHMATAAMLERLHQQSLRVDAMVTRFLDATNRAGVYVVESVSKPVRQISGLMATIRSIVESLRTPAPKRPPTRPNSGDSY